MIRKFEASNSPAMRKRTLGQSRLEVSALRYGAMGLAPATGR